MGFIRPFLLALLVSLTAQGPFAAESDLPLLPPALDADAFRAAGEAWRGGRVHSASAQTAWPDRAPALRPVAPAHRSEFAARDRAPAPALDSPVGRVTGKGALLDYGDAVLRLAAAPDNGDDRVVDFVQFAEPEAVVSDADGNLYVFDSEAHSIRLIERSTGLVSTVVGIGQPGFNGDGLRGEDTAVSLFRTGDVVLDEEHNLFFSDGNNNRIRRLDAATGRVTTVAGNGSAIPQPLIGTGMATQVPIVQPKDLAIKRNGLLYALDRTTSNTEEGDRLLLIDLNRGLASQGSIPLTRDASIAILEGDRLVLCLGDEISQIFVENPQTNQFEGLVDGASLQQLFGLDRLQCRAMATDGDDIYVAVGDGQLFTPNLVVRIDVSERFADAAGFEGQFQPRSLAVLPTGELATTQGAEVGILTYDPAGVVAVLGLGDPASFCEQLLDSAAVGRQPAVASTPDGELFVSQQLKSGEAAVLQINEATNQLTDVFRTSELFGLVLFDVAVDREGTVFVTADFDDGTEIARIDRSGNVSKFDLPSAFDDYLIEGTNDLFYPLHISVSKDGSTLLVGLGRVLPPGSNEVCLLDAVTGRVQDCFSDLVDPETGQIVNLADVALDETGRTAYLADDRTLRSEDYVVIQAWDTRSFAMTRVAGSGPFGTAGEGGSARSAQLDRANAIDFGYNGVLYVMGLSRLLAVDLERDRLQRIAGTRRDPREVTSDPLPADGVRARNLDLQFDPFDRMTSDAAGNVYFSRLFSRRIGTLDRVGTSIRLGGDPGVQGFGSAISASGDRVAIGVPGLGAGEVSIYRNDDCRLVLEERIGVPDGFTASGFGAALSLDGERLLVGTAAAAKGVNDGIGAALFERVGSAWNFKQALAPGDAGQDFGSAVALSGNAVLVGAPGADGGAGAAHLFEFDGVNLQAVASIAPPGNGPGRFGAALDADRGSFVVGAPGREGQAGAAAVYSLGSGGPEEVALVQAQSPAENDGFGTAVAIDDAWLLVGAPGAANSQGRAYALALGAGAIGTSLELAAEEPAAGDDFGRAVALDGGLGFVGSPGTPGANGGTGAVFGFDLDRAAAKGGTAPAKQVVPRFFQNQLGAAVSVNLGRAFGGAPATGDSRGDAVAASEVIDAGRLAGLWFDPTLDGEGFNVITASAGTVIYFFGYASTGDRLWLVSDTLPDELTFGDTILLRVFDASEGTFDRPVGSATALRTWGNVRLTVISESQAAFELNGFEGNKASRAIKLLGIGGTNGGLGGLWFDPALEGEGYNVVAGPGATIIYYYGSTADGRRLWLASETFTGAFAASTPITLDLFEFRGGTFVSPAPSAMARREWGQITLEFSSCGEAIFTLDGNDGTKRSDATLLAGIVGAECGLR